MRTYSTRKRVLVTDGAGFLGSHLCERLLAEGNDVLCADTFGNDVGTLRFAHPTILTGVI